MIIIFGRRSYGRVDAHGSEYAQTTFAHIYYVPLIPTGSFWVTSEAGGQRTGFSIPLHGKSVAAAYLRVWAPIAALATLSAAPLIAGVPVALVLLGLSAWAWSWRSVRGELALRRSDFNRLAFGMRCEPSAMSPEVRAQVGANLRARWDRSGAQRSPNDVGTFGATDPGEAVIAYGLLSLSALEHGGRDERDAAERILRGTHDPLPAAEDGPYREGTRPAPAAVHEQIASAAASVEAHSTGAVHAAVAGRKRVQAPVVRAKKFGVAGILIGLIAVGGLTSSVRSLRPLATGTVAEVVAARGDGDFATVTCAHSEYVGDLQEGARTTHHVFFCEQADAGAQAAPSARKMAVLAGPEVADLDTLGPITGKLALPGYEDRQWHDEMRNEPGIERLYLTVESVCAARALALGSLFGLLAALGLGAYSIRGVRRARRVLAATPVA